MEDNIKIISDNKWREVFGGSELPEKIRKEYDNVEEIDKEIFFKYRGEYYWLGEFCNITEGCDVLKDWHAMMSLTAFSGIVIKVHPQESTLIIVGRFVPCSSKKTSDEEFYVMDEDARIAYQEGREWMEESFFQDIGVFSWKTDLNWRQFCQALVNANDPPVPSYDRGVDIDAFYDGAWAEYHRQIGKE